MKKVFFSVVFSVAVVFITAAQVVSGACEPNVPLNIHFSRGAVLDAILKKYTTNGLPGASMAVYTEQEGWWAGAAGYSRLETKTPMNNCHLQYLQSVSKTYMAVVIMKLYEEGKMRLEAPITTYLPRKYSNHIKYADKMTIRMLLNHNSGVPEYSTNPAFVSYVLLHPTTIFKIEDALSYISGEDTLFTPGRKHAYTNTNYLLLALIADAVTGDHAKYMEENIFKPLQLNHTYYRGSKDYLHYATLTDSYWDALNVGKPANITAFQQANVATLKGDDGIVCTTTDAIKFLKGLMEGRLLRDSTLRLMQQWVNDDKGNPIYGLGLVHYAAGGLVGFGHSGAGVGAGCILIYVPAKKTYVFLATNLGILVKGELAEKADAMKDEVLAALLF